MGMFDTVHFKCPHCDKDAEVQTKVGPCLLNHYELHEVTGAIAEALTEGRACSECGETVEFEAKVIVQLRIKGAEH